MKTMIAYTDISVEGGFAIRTNGALTKSKRNVILAGKLRNNTSSMGKLFISIAKRFAKDKMRETG